MQLIISLLTIIYLLTGCANSTELQMPVKMNVDENRIYNKNKLHTETDDNNELANIDPTDPVVLYNAANAFAEAKDYDLAIKYYSQAININSLFYQAYYNRGNTWFSLKEYEKSISDYSAAIEINPEYESAYIGRGGAWRELGDFKCALENYRKAIIINPKSALAFHNIGIILFLINNYDSAIQNYSEAIKIDPNYFEAYFNRANALIYNGDDDGAISDLNKVIILNPNYYDAYLNRGIALYNKKKYDLSNKDITFFIKNSKNEKSEAYIYRSFVWQKKCDYKLAIKDLKKVLDIDSSNLEAIKSLAWIFATCKEKEYRDGYSALKLCENIKKESPDIDVIDIMAAAYAEMGDFENAIKYQKKAIDLLKDKSISNDSEYIKHYKTYLEHIPWREECNGQ